MSQPDVPKQQTLRHEALRQRASDFLRCFGEVQVANIKTKTCNGKRVKRRLLKEAAALGVHHRMS